MAHVGKLLALILLLAGCQTLPVAPAPGVTTSAERDQYTDLRTKMVSEQIEARGIRDANILSAMRTVPRHAFVPDDYVEMAYADHPLPIGYGQTISQPYIVALMTEAIRPDAGQRVLEIGTGSGYQAAVLDQLGLETYTVEIIPALAQQAEERLAALGYERVHIRQADGYFGWEEHAPYDAIMVTAAPDHLPQPLVGQLADGGRLVIPIGPTGSYQSLWLFEREGDELLATNLGGVSFVPFTGEGIQQP